jgi:hypothetical protein
MSCELWLYPHRLYDRLGRILRLLLIAGLLPVLTSCSSDSGNSSTENFNQLPLELKLATHDGDSTDPIKVNRYRELMTQLANTYVDPPQGIYESIITARVILERKGISERLLDIMEGLNQILAKPMPNQKIDNYLAAYIELRNKGQSHITAVSGLRALMTDYEAIPNKGPNQEADIKALLGAAVQ